jgi:hypothetical protein
MNFSSDQIYKMKYLKYKAKYEQLKGGADDAVAPHPETNAHPDTNGVDNEAEAAKTRQAKEIAEKYENMTLEELANLKNELAKELNLIEPILQQKLKEEDDKKVRVKEEEEARLREEAEEKLKAEADVKPEVREGDSDKKKYYKNQQVNVNGFRKYYKY